MTCKTERARNKTVKLIMDLGYLDKNGSILLAGTVICI